MDSHSRYRTDAIAFTSTLYESVPGKQPTPLDSIREAVLDIELTALHSHNRGCASYNFYTTMFYVYNDF